MDVRLLGHLELVGDDGPLATPAGKPRSLLILLTLHANEAVETDLIIDALWGENPPPSAAATVHTYVSRLRKIVGASRIETVGHGYRFRLAGEERDIDRVDVLRERARLEPPPRAAESLREALSLYRGRPLADVADADFAQTDARRLEELRDAIVCERVEAELASGAHARVLAELESLVAGRPLDERLRGLLMIALYRSGRQADALGVYRAGYRALSEELGIEPSVELRTLQRRVLEQDPLLDLPRSPPTHPPAEESGRGRTLRRHWKLVAAATTYTIVLVAAGVAAGLSLSDPAPRAAAPIVGNSMTVIDPGELRVVESIPLGGRPGSIATSANAVWVALTDTNELIRISRGFEVAKRVDLGLKVTALETVGDAIWALGGFEAALLRLDAGGAVQMEVDLSTRFGPPPTSLGRQRGGLASSREGLWVAYGDHVALLDPESGRTIQDVELGGGWFQDIDVGAEVLVESIDGGNVHSADPRTYAIGRSIFTGRDVAAILVASGFGWIARYTAQQIWQVNESDMALQRTIDIDGSPTGLAFHDNAIWVATENAPSLHRLSAVDGRIEAQIDLALRPEGIAVANDLLWLPIATHER